MKHIRKKVKNNVDYYYLESNLKSFDKTLTFSHYIGKALPDTNVLKDIFDVHFKERAAHTSGELSANIKDYFPPKGAQKLEFYRQEFTRLNHELFEKEYFEFRKLFDILFTLNTNRAEGTDVTREEVETVFKKRSPPKTFVEKEAANSIEAINFAFSKKFHWNAASIKKVHKLLTHDIKPKIAGKYKKTDNYVCGHPTTPWKDVPSKMNGLLSWYKKNKRDLYPPISALRFHYKFEAIHPFSDYNGRVGRILLNVGLIEKGFSPVIFFSSKHTSYCRAIEKARKGHEKPLAKQLVDHTEKTWKAIEGYEKEGTIKGGSSKVGKWEISKGSYKIYWRG
jgi:fido (protein-threonine AMPylation protein)